MKKYEGLNGRFLRGLSSDVTSWHSICQQLRLDFLAGCIQISETTYQMLSPETQAMFKATGGVEVKVRAFKRSLHCAMSNSRA
jgi:hypothetical protein